MYCFGRHVKEGVGRRAGVVWYSHQGKAPGTISARLGKGDRLLVEAQALLHQGINNCAAYQFQQANSQLNKCVALLKKQKTASSKGHLQNAYNALGVVHSASGKLEEGNRNLRRALELCEKLGNPDSQIVMVGLLNDSASTCIWRGDYRDADLMLRRALRMSESARCPDSVLVAATYSHMGELFFERRRLDSAENALRKSLSWLPNNSPALSAAVRGNLGRVCLAKGETSEARNLLERAVEDARKNVPSSLYARCVSGLALYHLFKNEGTLAGELLEVALRDFNKTVGWYHPDTIACVNNLAAVQMPQEARSLYSGCLSATIKAEQNDKRIILIKDAVHLNQKIVDVVNREYQETKTLMDALIHKGTRQPRLQLMWHSHRIMGTGLLSRS